MVVQDQSQGGHLKGTGKAYKGNEFRRESLRMAVKRLKTAIWGCTTLIIVAEMRPSRKERRNVCGGK